MRGPRQSTSERFFRAPFFFFFQAEDGIRDVAVTGVQTCALPISGRVSCVRTVGHAYGSVYSGPIGAVITPLYQGLDVAGELPFASSLCGACGEICRSEERRVGKECRSRWSPYH